MPDIWTKLWAFLQTGPGMGFAGLAAIAAYLIFQNRGPIKDYFAGGTTAADVVAKPTRRQVMDYLDAAYSYFESVGCKEGMEAISTAVAHAFHEPPKLPDATASAVTAVAEAISSALQNKPAESPTA